MSAIRSSTSRERRLHRTATVTAVSGTEERAAVLHLSGIVRPASMVDVDLLEGLAERAALGDATAFEELYGELFTPIYRYVAVQVPTREDAEDLTQQIFEQLAIQIPTHRPSRTPFVTTVFRMARSVVLREHRVRDRRRAAETVSAAAEVVLTDEVVIRDEDLHECLAALDRLTPEQRQALALRYGAGLSAEAAAQVMSRQAGTIRGLTFRALTSIRKQLARRLPE